MSIAHIANRTAAPGRVWVGGCRKAQLIEVGIPKKDIISDHDWGNWVFSIPRNMLPLLEETI